MTMEVYICGNALYPPDHQYTKEVIVRESVSCSSPIEVTYYAGLFYREFFYDRPGTYKSLDRHSFSHETQYKSTGGQENNFCQFFLSKNKSHTLYILIWNRSLILLDAYSCFYKSFANQFSQYMGLYICPCSLKTVALSCAVFLQAGWVVASLTHSPFPFTFLFWYI